MLASVSIKSLSRLHPDRVTYQPTREDLATLYKGGPEFEIQISNFLFRRPQELTEVYQQRCKESAFNNALQTIVSWYTSALFKDPPGIIQRDPKSDKVLDAADDRQEPLTTFLADCVGNKTPLLKLYRDKVLPLALTEGAAYVLIDLPVTNAAAPTSTLKQQKDSGALSPYLTLYGPRQVINWSCDLHGVFEWVIVFDTVITQDDPLQPATVTDTWWVYDRATVAKYARVRKEDEKQPPPEDEATLQNYGPHSLANVGVVPIIAMEMPEDLWIGLRVKSPLISLLNLENTYDWSLNQTNCPTLVLYTDSDAVQNVKRSEVSFIRLGSADKAAYLEHTGKSYEASSKRLIEKREDLYRMAYLTAQAKSTSATASAQSGLSKQQDMMPARDILSSVGDITRQHQQAVLEHIAGIQSNGVEIDVSGYDFENEEDVSRIEMIERALTIDIQSDTFQKEVQKEIVREVFPDKNEDILKQMDKEIDDAPTASEQAAQQVQQQQQSRLQAVQAMNKQLPDLNSLAA